MAKTASSTTMMDSGSFQRAALGLSQVINIDTNNPFYTDEVNGLSIQSIVLSGDDYALVYFDAGDDLSKVMKFSKATAINATPDATNAKTNIFTNAEIVDVSNAGKWIKIRRTSDLIAQGSAAGVVNVTPLLGLYYFVSKEDSTAFTSLVEHTEYVSGDFDMLEGLTYDKGEYEFGYFTEVVLSAGKLRGYII